MDMSQWPAIKQGLHDQFADLTESELEETHGDLNELEDLMAEKLGKSRDEARRQLETFLKPFENKPPMISDGIKGEVQNLKDDLQAPSPRDVAPGIQSGVSGKTIAPDGERPDQVEGGPIISTETTKTNY